jgi:hypothetical protein
VSECDPNNPCQSCRDSMDPKVVAEIDRYLAQEAEKRAKRLERKNRPLHPLIARLRSNKGK